jgi:gliding motility-associated-like protein
MIKPLFPARLLIMAAFFFSYLSVMAQPSNNVPCTATPLTVSGSCNFQTFATNGATRSSVQNPSCGNYAGSADVWFVTQVPASGTLQISTTRGSLTNMSMAIYSAATCNGPFTEIACATEGSVDANMPRISRTGLTPGSYVFIRVWDRVCTTFLLCGFSTDQYQEGTFGICVTEFSQVTSGGSNTGSYDCSNTPPAGNTCEEATQICTFNGYCGSTQGYTADFWFSGSQGLGGTLTAQGIFCGSIENNSFIKFIASTDRVELDVIVSGSSSACDEGVQFLMFGNPTGGAACQSLQIVSYGCLSPMPRGNNRFVATGLAVGQEYYLMVDGFAGDRCTYQINAISGVLIGISAGNDKTICQGSTVELSVFGAAPGTVNWTGPGLNSNTGTTVTATPTAPGTFQYIVEAPNPGVLCGGPPRTTDTVLVTVLPPLEDISITQTGDCASGSTVITASGAATYTWSPSQGLSATSGSTVTANPSQPTTYTVVASNGAGCTVTKEILVNPGGSGPALTASASQNIICQGGSGAILTAADGFDSYTWAPATGLSATTGQTVTANPLAPGVYQYTVSATFPGCPTSTATVSITVQESGEIALTASPQQICAGTPVTISASPQGAYDWTGPDGFSQQGVGGITITPTSTGVYTVAPTGCLTGSSIEVSVTPIPAALVAVNGEGCVTGTSIQLGVTGQCAGTVNWYAGAAGTEVLGTGSTFNTPVLTENTVFYAACVNNGCEGSRTEVLAEFVFNPPVADAGDVQTILCAIGQAQLSGSVSVSDVSINWTGPGLVSGSNTLSPFVDQPGIYTLLISNECGSGADEVEVFEEDNCECEVFIPNAFSPNGDGLHDRLELRQDGITSYRLIIYTRWGERVYETTSFDETWDGAYKEKAPQSDVFGYYYEGSCNTGEKIIRQGNITVVK